VLAVHNCFVLQVMVVQLFAVRSSVVVELKAVTVRRILVVLDSELQPVVHSSVQKSRAWAQHCMIEEPHFVQLVLVVVHMLAVQVPVAHIVPTDASIASPPHIPILPLQTQQFWESRDRV
jgi:hypothetical protein